MEETPLKRQREETQIVELEEEEVLKRQKSYKDIISILEEEEDEPNQDLSSLMTTLQQELSSSSSYSYDNFSSVSSSLDSVLVGPVTVLNSSSSSEADPTEIMNSSTVLDYNSLSPSQQLTVKGEGEEEEKEKVMRHLLEASDDELGLPNAVGAGGEAVVVEDDDQGLVMGAISGGDLLPLGGDGLWDFEDHEAANYYSFFQSELFM
ncbi:hypothetical protein Ancab_020691 [Ancistrocladus abbreviatus]